LGLERSRDRETAWRHDVQSCALIDPLLFMVADDYDCASGAAATLSPRRLRFVILAYTDMVQIVARFGADSHASIAISPGLDTYMLGTKLVKVLERWTRMPVM